MPSVFRYFNLFLFVNHANLGSSSTFLDVHDDDDDDDNSMNFFFLLKKARNTVLIFYI